MTEVLGVVSSVIAVTGLAGQLAKHTLSLKQLWGDAQDAPQSVSALNDQLTVAGMIIAEIEASFVQAPPDFCNTPTAKLIVQQCKTVVDDIGSLVDELSESLTSSSWVKRSKGRLKAVTRKQYVESYQDRLSRALQLLALSHQLYSM